MKILTSTQMAEVDRRTSEEYGLPSLLLMENAGLQLFLVLTDYFDDLTGLPVAIICGKGNNGGDGMVLARQLRNRGLEVEVFLLASPDTLKGDALMNLQAYTRGGGEVTEIRSEEEWQRQISRLGRCRVIVDGILGTGIAKPVEGLYAAVVKSINSLDAFVLAIDCPSGVFSDSVERSPLCVYADATVTFTAPKIAHILSQDQEAFGDLHIVPIGTPSVALESPEFKVNLLTEDSVCPDIPLRLAASHKGTYGHAVIIAGSEGKAGAAALAAMAALRAGSGLVTACVPRSIQPVVSAFRAELMTESFPATEKGSFASKAAGEILDFMQEKQALGLGPGISVTPDTVELVHTLLEQAAVPVVLDADGLNCLAQNPDVLGRRSDWPLILTPHPGEFARLINLSASEVLGRQLEVVPKFAQEHKVWVVLKTFRTLIAAPNGTCFVSPTGNAGMATAGAGDVLTGVLTSLLGQYAAVATVDGDAVGKAVCLGVYLHGLAGDLAAEERGMETLLAGDILEHLGPAYEILSDSE